MAYKKTEKRQTMKEQLIYQAVEQALREAQRKLESDK